MPLIFLQEKWVTGVISSNYESVYSIVSFFCLVTASVFALFADFFEYKRLTCLKDLSEEGNVCEIEDKTDNLSVVSKLSHVSNLSLESKLSHISTGSKTEKGATIDKDVINVKETTSKIIKTESKLSHISTVSKTEKKTPIDEDVINVKTSDSAASIDSAGSSVDSG